jgi:signal transduction histidine kinase
MLVRRLEREAPLDLDNLREALARLDHTATRAAAQVDELLDLARLQMGGPLELKRESHDLIELTRGVLAEHALASDRHEIRLESSEPALVGEWDERRLTRVIGNLLDNAIKYSPNGGLVEVQVSREDGEAVLSVRDYGIGVPAAEMESIFERFQRAANVVGRIKGTGLGLASARHIVEAHEGTILVESREGEGTTFTVRLPLHAKVLSET